ncbi:unnamed protein product [Rotaria sp. Silwood2]|nr:unnamed protein product [Rotaria sp. Silwood2]CAF3128169.1 unnamed protein product [Rotaria sp. Silwood2]CAF3326862.1 unnamed protein product [Rotaria sp. Silwood2]CAF3445118.1 unnamed protein product [Rotaria sp. Silwood2]CAF4353863.1 unnamed protein product [Rotaria sp. Silwood2]
MLKYIRQEIVYRRRHHWVSLYRQQKRSSFEYMGKKTMERIRDQFRAQIASIGKRKLKPIRDERKILRPYKHMITYGYHKKYDKISAVRNVNKFQWGANLLNAHLYFPEAAIASARSVTCNNQKILLRYCNQRIFIYSMPANHCNRPSNKYLINIFSSLDNIGPGLFDKQRPPLSRPRPPKPRPPPLPRPLPPAPPGQATIKWPRTQTQKPETQTAALAKSQHHNYIPSQLAQSVNQNKKKSKGQRKKNC